MSGISVLFHRDRRPVKPQALGEMLEAMQHRGQDGLTGRLFDDVALGHASTIVLAEDEGVIQPIVSPRTGCAIVADVRLDNREELLALLRDCPPGVSDAEIILRAYERWGLDTPKRLLGDFAFAIWDSKRQRMVCARDVAAQRTLYYRLDGHTFAAATEIQSLFQDPTVPLVPNDERILDSLVPYNLMANTRDRADTYFVGIHCLQAAHLLVVDRRDSTIKRYWQIDPNNLPHVCDDESDEQFRAIFFEAVRARLRTSRRTGVFLSGGLDSTSIACTAQTLIQRGLAAAPGFVGISATYPGMECDERAFVEATRDMYGFETHFVEIDPELETFDLLLTDFRESPDLPTSGTSSLLRHADGANVSVVMTGEVADSIVLGSPFMLDYHLRCGSALEYWQNLQFCRSLGYSTIRLVAIHSLLPFLPLRIFRQASELDARRDHGKISWRLTPSWLTHDLKEELLRRDLECRLAEQRRRMFRSLGQHMEHRGIDPPEKPLNAVGRAIELTRPFADRRVWEFLLAVPPTKKIDLRAKSPYAAMKQVLRRGLRDIVPDTIRSRGEKAIFSSTVPRMMSMNWQVIESILHPEQRSRIDDLNIIDRHDFWRELILIRDHISSRDILYARHIIGLELWLRALSSRSKKIVTTRQSVSMCLDSNTRFSNKATLNESPNMSSYPRQDAMIENMAIRWR